MTKKIQLHKDFENLFGDKIYKSTFNYIVNEHDLIEAAKIFNKHIFNSKINLDEIEFIVSSSPSFKDKGNFSIGHAKNPNAKFMLRIVKNVNGDNLFQILNVLAHELIHAYDMFNGKINEIFHRHSSEILSGFYVINQNGKQFVGIEKYEAHGKYFKIWQDKINSYGFNVQEKYSIRGKSKMKKLDDSDVEQLEDFLDETDASKEAMTYQVVKRIFDSIVAPGKRLVWRSAKEWFIEFP